MAYDDLPAIKPKIPLAVALTDLAVLMNEIDSADSIDDTLIKLFGTALANVSDAVDRRILFRQQLDSTIKSTKEMAKAWREKAAQLESVMERFEGQTLAIMGEEDAIAYKGKLGQLCSQKNPAKLELAFETKSVNFSNAILTDTVNFFDIPAEFLQDITVKQLLKDKVKEALQAGAKLEWATLVYNRHLRVRV